MARLRLSRAAAVTFTADAALFRTDLGTVALDGREVVPFLARLVPLLDGTRDLDGVAGALEREYTRASVVGLVGLLTGRGLVEEVSELPDEEARFAGQRDFFAQWTDDPASLLRRLRGARVVVVGLEPWGVGAAVELAAAGIGALHLMDTAPVTDDDLLAARAFTRDHVGRSRAAAVAEVIATAAPWTVVTTGALARDDVGGLALPAGAWDLVVATTPADDLAVLDAVARAAHTRTTPSICAHLDLLEAVVGPLVIPGETACWNCTRLRHLATSDTPAHAHALQHVLLRDGARPRRRTYLAPMAGQLAQLVALEAIKFLTRYAPSTLVGRVLTQDLVRLDLAWHTVVRMPWCSVCGGAVATGLPRDGAPTTGVPSTGVPSTGVAAGGATIAPRPLDAEESPEALRARLAGWVDARVGVVRALRVHQADVDEPELPITTSALLSDYTDGEFRAREPELGSGKGLTAVQAMVGAMGEAVERYSAARVPPGRVRRAVAAALDADVLDPTRLAHYADAQYARAGFPFARVDPDQPIDWTLGRWLGSDEPVWVPAFPTYYNLHVPRAERFCQVSSNGLAAGSTDHDAAMRATLELVERDAFTLTWLAQLPGRRLLPDDALDPGAREVMRQLELCHARIELYLLDAGLGIPTVMCLALGDGVRWPGATVALSTHPDPCRAVAKALLEQGHVGPYIRRLMRDGSQSVPATPDDVRSLIDHAMYYVPRERQAAFDFLRCVGDAPVPLGALPVREALSEAECAEMFARDGVRVAIADVTAPDVATGPFRVARALGEDVQPIHFGHALGQLANPRLVRRAARGLHPHPHPLA
ncbi:MAG TPA: TOMM precursor leader peptide-binding protein [Gemmatirosa sp.]